MLPGGSGLADKMLPLLEVFIKTSMESVNTGHNSNTEHSRCGGEENEGYEEFSRKNTQLPLLQFSVLIKFFVCSFIIKHQY
jgi:hypothetical protein